MQDFFNTSHHDDIETVIGRDGRHTVVLSRRPGMVLLVIDIVFLWSSVEPDILSLSFKADISRIFLCKT